ncbi:MAG: tRNA (guanosine(46)-N7)-methyltransferase TrmB [Lachnospiraceae bacterium]|nr:tRNA (guanosine(46)-N7)-methyltransferase TrmB [Lachnospiraceae bacterium]
MRLRNIPGATRIVGSSPFVVQDYKGHKGEWNEIFRNENPIRIEVGMGKGRFIMDMARLYPDINFVGIERYDSVLLRAVQKMEDLISETGTGLPNLRFLCMDARELPEVFALGEVDLVYLNFSDPWPKDRHAKRRLTSREFLKRYEQILAPGHYMEFKTDNVGLFDFSLEEVQEAGWCLEVSTHDLHGDKELVQGNVMTEYEEKFSGMGNKICKLVTYYK